MSKDVINQAQLAGVDWSAHEPKAPARDYDPGTWMGRPDITFHSSHEHPMPYEDEPGEISYDIRHQYGFGPGFHSGTLNAAMERGAIVNERKWIEDMAAHQEMRKFVHPVRMTGDVALPSTERYGDKMVFTDNEANVTTRPTTAASGFSRQTLTSDVEQHLAQGRHVPYENTAEDAGSVSYRSPREKLSTWSEDVLSDPNAPHHHRVLAEQFDLTVPVRENVREIATIRRQHSDATDELEGEHHMPLGSGTSFEQPSLFEGEHMPPHQRYMKEPQVFGQSRNISVTTPRLKRK